MTLDLLNDNNVPDDNIQLDETKDYYEELVGDGKKFKTPQDLAKGKYVADHYVKTLERRLDEAREEYKKVLDDSKAGPKLQDLIDRNEALLQQLASKESPSLNEAQKTTYDPKEIESLVSQTYLKERQSEREQANYNLVRDKLTERFGTNYKNIVKEQATALGLSDEEINSMARKNPNLFIKTFDLNVTNAGENFQTPPKSQQRSDNFAPSAVKGRKKSYYVELKKKDPMAWFEPKIAVQMEKDAQTLGKDFYDV